ncbi:MAG: N-acetyl-gamma-glutamyl-phosphate reductase [Acutalibacteraceae bacterium]
MKRIFIDGKSGTTGLRIFDRLADRDDIEIITLSDELRKDTAARKEALNSSDLSFLCLPDSAAIQAIEMVENPDTVIIDASTAHRTLSGWEYGFPEIFPDGINRIKSSKRIAVPGCHASGFAAIVKPLTDSGLLLKNAKISCFSFTGYSGGGNAMIAEYKNESRAATYSAPRVYALSQNHKHLKEMTSVTGLVTPPVFSPAVADFYSGMLVTVNLFGEDLVIGADVCGISEVYKSRYNGKIVFFCDSIDENGFISANAMSGRDSMAITVNGNSDRIMISALFDNLGKGASGAAVECMNIVFGLAPEHSLIL